MGRHLRCGAPTSGTAARTFAESRCDASTYTPSRALAAFRTVSAPTTFRRLSTALMVGASALTVVEKKARCMIVFFFFEKCIPQLQ